MVWCAREQLIERRGDAFGAGVFANRREIGGDLPVQQPECLQVVGRERAEPPLPRVGEQRFEAPPVRRALIEPAAGDHEWMRTIV